MDEKQIPLGGTAIKPVGWDRTGWEKFRYFLYNPDTGAFLSRTPESWLKIILFYIIYYSLLTIFWIACLQIFFTTLPEGRPRWLLSESIIGTNPGLGIRPGMPDSRIDSSLFVISAASEDMKPTNDDGEGDKNADYVQRITNFLGKYNNSTGMSDCTEAENRVRAPEEKNCLFDKSVLGACAKKPYGYVVQYPDTNVVEPCFFLKFNKIFDWNPVPVNASELDEPAFNKMTPQLKARIRRSSDINYLWIDCDGRYPADREAVEIEYFPPHQGIPLKYFPFRGGQYQPPLIAIKVHQVNPQGETGTQSVNYGQLIHLECRAWYHGVVHDTKDKLGLVQFDLMLEPVSE